MICLFGSAQERSLATARATIASAADATKPRAYGRFNRLICICCPSQDSEASYRINEDQVRGLLRPGNSTPLMTARGQTRLFGDVDVRCPKATTGRFIDRKSTRLNSSHL